eukprot:CAMPEP_0117449938 /NCGR_PEP_ID=MMETSP0759-20121206/8206_1 /TAXON_ID=63605 /ORGANISM="Percolomonas cosmopolitus, Strain WS" /LENGTH=386 /DNA_ID=CAMNT_0005242435 /DNA_START=168 /DNA_END=1328 /DNA_ORIENTATION=-
MSGLSSLDIYPKTSAEYSKKTTTGGTISIIAIVLIIILTLSEISYYLRVRHIDILSVDTTHNANQKLPIYLNITFPSVSCDALSLDVMDVSGDHQVDVEHSFYKTRLHLDGTTLEESTLQEKLDSKSLDEERAKKAIAVRNKENYCGSCYGAEDTKSQCCNSCDQVREAYRKKGWAFTPHDDIEQCYTEVMERKMKYAKEEGCNLYGHFLVNKVAGNFHFAPGRTFQSAQAHMRDYIAYEVEHFNTSHVIHKLSFGVPYPGAHNPLDAVQKMINKGSALYQYFIKVVPTVYEYASGTQIRTNQYSVTQHMRPRNAEHSSVVPGVFFMYDLSPIMMHIKEERKSFLHFITSLCAIVGGVITVSGIADAVLHHFSSRRKDSSMVLPHR